jgi:hypothetical protein
VSGAGSVLAVLASAVIVLSGMAALSRAVWVAAQDLRDNKHATAANTRALDNLAAQLDGRLTAIERRLGRLESPGGGGTAAS